MAFANEYKDVEAVEANSNTKLHVIHTNDKKQVAITLTQYERHLSLRRHKIVGIDLEYNNEPEATQKPTLCQLSIGKKHPVLLFQLSTLKSASSSTTSSPTPVTPLQASPSTATKKGWITSIWSMLIDDYYNNMKKKITDDEHKRWATLPLSRRHIEYVVKDAYAAYEIWNRNTLT
ncbi:hypothetical protein VPH35_021443 [Triticum aestivum]